MSRFTLIPLALFVLVTGACGQEAREAGWGSVTPQEQRSITWQIVPMRLATGEEVQTHTIHEGDGTPSDSYETLFFKGKLNERAAGTTLYAFLIWNAEDEENVNGFLANHRPDAWADLPKDSPWRERIKPRKDFVKLSVGDDGSLFLALDEYEHPGCTKLTALLITDAGGTLIDRLERR